MTLSPRLTGALLAALFFALHLPFLPPSLEDLDSINFALGVRDFDVARHQPHPPGYPLFVVAAKAVHAAGLAEWHALSLLSVAAGALAILALMTVFRALERDRSPGLATWLAILLAVTCPLYWLTAARPLSDVAGLAAALGAQGLILRASAPKTLFLAALCASFAAGLRSQVVWLTVPLLLFSATRMPRGESGRGFGAIAVGGAAGALMWLGPLVVISGGPRAYWDVFFNQGAEDLGGVTMLATTPTVRQLVSALRYAFVAPWGYWQTGAAVLAAAAVGLVHMFFRGRQTLVMLSITYVPYLLFDLLFQESITTRYALPLVIPVAYLAVRGLCLMPPIPATTATLALISFLVLVDERTLVPYSRMEAPAFRMLGDMRAFARSERHPTTRPVLAMHRREDFDLRRPIQWVGDQMPGLAERLPAPPKHEWLELVKYWNRGGRNPVWFVADPLRSDLALVRAQRRPALYRWPFDLTSLVGGARPNEMDWHIIEDPDWYLGEGWALTPETAGIAGEDQKGPGHGPISGWVRRRAVPVTFMIGGRNLAGAGAPARVNIAIDGATVDELAVPPGFFLRMIDVPSLTGAGDYATIAVESDSPELAVEQFDAQPAGWVMFGFDEGWHEQEYNPALGVLWRWTSDRAILRVRAGGRAVALTLRGETEAASTSHVVIRVGSRIVAEFDAERSFARTVIIPSDTLQDTESRIAIESSASYVPAETRWRSQDRRRLGLKLYECRVTPAS